MPALRFQFVDLSQLAPLGSARVLVPIDCWEWWLICNDPQVMASWTINGVSGANLFGVDANTQVAMAASTEKFGGIFDGHGRAVNFNAQLILTNNNADRACPATLVKVYWDERLTDPDMPL